MLQRLLLEIFKNAKSVGLGADKRDPQRSVTPGEHTAMRVNDTRAMIAAIPTSHLPLANILEGKKQSQMRLTIDVAILFAHTVLNASF